MFLTSGSSQIVTMEHSSNINLSVLKKKSHCTLKIRNSWEIPLILMKKLIKLELFNCNIIDLDLQLCLTYFQRNLYFKSVNNFYLTKNWKKWAKIYYKMEMGFFFGTEEVICFLLFQVWNSFFWRSGNEMKIVLFLGKWRSFFQSLAMTCGFFSIAWTITVITSLALQAFRSIFDQLLQFFRLVM